MPKRTRSGEVLIRPPVGPECNAHVQALEENIVDNQPRPQENSVTSGSPRLEANTYLVGEVPAIDVAAEELLATNPFWSLLLSSGYTWW